MSLEIYKETILEHYRNPTNAGVVKNPDVISKDYNPSCGDVVEIQIKFDNDKIKKIKFQGQGCAISQSSTDILIDGMKGKKTDDVKNISSEDFIKKLNIELSPLRLKCALLGLKTLKTAVYSYIGK
ncbi:MAG: SUF system NifU family Fe-S cluster assembly protein [Candidatus Aenigmarchaeota archaeon]|nr:SUF system NifU family Fe-S cluster assembly protein [Candidatus Aenigmarchaeota archaeon]